MNHYVIHKSNTVLCVNYTSICKSQKPHTLTSKKGHSPQSYDLYLTILSVTDFKWIPEGYLEYSQCDGKIFHAGGEAQFFESGFQENFLNITCLF